MAEPRFHVTELQGKQSIYMENIAIEQYAVFSEFKFWLLIC